MSLECAPRCCRSNDLVRVSDKLIVNKKNIDAIQQMPHHTFVYMKNGKILASRKPMEKVAEKLDIPA